MIGPKVTLLKGTRQNVTHLETFFRCQNCIGASLKEIDWSSEAAPVSLVLSQVIPYPSGDVNAPIAFNNSDAIRVLMNFKMAHFNDYFSRVKPNFTPVPQALLAI
jgi:hypothetical protein